MGWKTERLLAIILLLQSRGRLTARELSKILEVSCRTIYRDIQSLSIAGVPVCESPGPRGGYTLPENYAIEPTLFTQDEVVSLVLGGSVIAQYRHLDIAGSAKSALLKIESCLPSVYPRVYPGCEEAYTLRYGRLVTGIGGKSLSWHP
jgi:predicted DNA-binding transcriptional regulator YafY